MVLSRHEQRIFLGPAGLDFRAGPYPAAPPGVIQRKAGRVRPGRTMRGVVVGPGRSLRHRDGARGARPLSSPRRPQPAFVLRNPRPQLRSGPGQACADDRYLAPATPRSAVMSILA